MSCAAAHPCDTVGIGMCDCVTPSTLTTTTLSRLIGQSVSFVPFVPIGQSTSHQSASHQSDSLSYHRQITPDRHISQSHHHHPVRVASQSVTPLSPGPSSQSASHTTTARSELSVSQSLSRGGPFSCSLPAEGADRGQRPRMSPQSRRRPWSPIV